MTTLHSVSKLALWTADKISWKKAFCSFSLVGAYKLSSRNGDSWMVISNYMYRPSSSVTIFISYCSCSLIRTSTPLLWFEPWLKIISPRHWNFQSFIISGVLYVSWRNVISDFCFSIHVNMDLRLWRSRLPRALSDVILKLNSPMFLFLVLSKGEIGSSERVKKQFFCNYCLR